MTDFKKEKINFEASGWHEQMFKNELVSVLESMEDETPNLLFSEYLISIITFLENCYHEGKLEDVSIIEAAQKINAFLGLKAFGKRNDVHKNALRVGLIVEFLFQKGLPRKYCIPAVAEWLDIKERTVRNYNEIYRKRRGKGEINGLAISMVDRQFFFGATKVEPLLSIKDTFEQTPNFPNNHPRSKKAFEACLKTVKEDGPYKKTIAWGFPASRS